MEPQIGSVFISTTMNCNRVYIAAACGKHKQSRSGGKENQVETD